MKKSRKWFLTIPILILGIFATLLLISALSNLGLPVSSQWIERLDQAEKARLAEAWNLRTSAGEQIWPGWGEASIPFVIYNESYVFLVGLQDPEQGWVKVPSGPNRGGAWELVPGDDFYGQPYYRQPLPAQISPLNPSLCG
jgi:hypothetical protein